jgi:hypothetical protein
LVFCYSSQSLSLQFKQILHELNTTSAVLIFVPKMVKQIHGSNSNFKTSICNKLNNNNSHNLSAKWNQDLLSTNLESHLNNSSLLYSSDNNSLNVYYQNVRGLKGKTSELISSLYPGLPHLLCLTEHSR